MSNSETVSMSEIGKRGALSAADVLTLRQEIYGASSEISQAHAERIIALDETCTLQDPSWQEFYIEAITDYIVEQSEPRGYVTVQNAEWLIGMLERNGRVETTRGIELLVNILDKSRWSPSTLVEFAMQQVKIAVIEDEGPLRDGRELENGAIGAAEVDLLRRILFAFGGDGNMAISRGEAEILFDINEATLEASNDPAWTDLFTKSIANYVMGTSGYQMPSRKEALRQEERLADHESDSKDFIKRMVSGGLKGVWAAYREQSQEDRELARLEEQKIRIITAEAITEDEADWLVERIQRDGDICENEKALLAFIRDESPDIHPSLKPLLETAA